MWVTKTDNIGFTLARALGNSSAGLDINTLTVWNSDAKHVAREPHPALQEV